MSTSENKPQRLGTSRSVSEMVIPYLYIILPIFLSTAYVLVGFYVENGTWDITQLITGPVFTQYKYTLLECLFDVDQLLALFVNTILYSFLFAAVFLTYGKTDKETLEFKDFRSLSKNMKVFAVLSAGIFFTAIVLSLTGLKLQRPEWDDNILTMITSNFYPEFFSYSLLPLIIFATGFIFIPYVLGNARRKGLSNWKPNPIGKIYFIIFIVIFEILFFTMPLILEEVLATDIIREFLYHALDLLLITGAIMLIEYRERKVQISLNNPTNIEELNPKQPEKIDKILDEKTDEKADQKTEIPKTRKLNQYQKHALAWLLSFIIVTGLIVLMLVLINGGLNTQLSIGKLVSRIWVIAFQFCFTLFLYFMGTAYRKNQLLESEDDV
jgi:hypothetical protein